MTDCFLVVFCWQRGTEDVKVVVVELGVFGLLEYFVDILGDASHVALEAPEFLPDSEIALYTLLTPQLHLLLLIVYNNFSIIGKGSFYFRFVNIVLWEICTRFQGRS